MNHHSSDLLAIPQVAERVARSATSTRALTLLAADLAAFAAASGMALALTVWHSGATQLGLEGPPPEQGARWEDWSTLLVLLGLLAVLGARGRYTARLPFWTDLGRIAGGVLVGLLADSFVRSSLFGLSTDPQEILRWVLFLPCVVALRQAARMALQARGHWGLRTLIVGDGPAVAGTRAALNSQRHLGYDVVGSLGLDRALAYRLGQSGGEALRSLGAEFVVVAMGGRDRVAETGMAAALSRAKIPFALAPVIDGLPVSGLAQQSFMAHDVMLLTYGNNLARPACRLIKGLFDQAVAAAALVLLSPLFLVLCAMIRLDGGPAFFGHGRIGEGGQRFRCLKFRSMSVHGDRILQDLLERDPAARLEWEATRKLRRDPRVTRIGRVLRKTSLDELPQLLNVLRGQMSLVGPRPIVDAEVSRYGDKIAFYYEAKPGITGLWQVSGRSDTSYDERVKLDVWYVRNWTLLHDMAILLKTVPAVLLKRGAV